MNQLSKQYNSDFSISGEVDLSNLSEEKMLNLRVLVAQFKATQERCGHEFLNMCTQMANMRDILGTQSFKQFASNELGLKASTINRCLKVYDLSLMKFTDDENRVVIGEVKQLTRGALETLMLVDDEEVISQVRQLAQQGEKVSDALVKQIIDARDRDYAADLEIANAGKKRAEDALKKEQELRANESGRSFEQKSKLEEQLRRNAELIQTLEGDLEQERTKQPETTIKIVEKVPEGFTTAQEAIGKITIDLQQAKAQKEALLEDLEATKQQVERIKASSEEFSKLKEQLDAILIKYPLTRLSTIHSGDKVLLDAIKNIGRTYIQVGQHLCQAA